MERGPEPGLVQGCPIPAQRLSQGWPQAGPDCAEARPKLWRLVSASGLRIRASESTISLALVVLSLIHFFSCLAARHKVLSTDSQKMFLTEHFSRVSALLDNESGLRSCLQS